MIRHPGAFTLRVLKGFRADQGLLLAFTVLENAMSVFFLHRVAILRRHFLISALLLLLGAQVISE